MYNVLLGLTLNGDHLNAINNAVICFFTYKDGLVYTFGAGGAGQLGHNSTRNELTPRVVAELWGARVSQVACGRWESTLIKCLLGQSLR